MTDKVLACVGRIVETAPIDGADRIQRATVDCGPSGRWTGVVGLDVLPGHIVTVFLQDAVLPPDPRWAFMEKSKWRVRMARFKGAPSECLILPLDSSTVYARIGANLTEALGVKKYEKPIPESMDGDVLGAFPDFIPKTDEPNFQTVLDWREKMASGDWYATIKYDGTSCTAWVNDGDDEELRVCSRNWELREKSASGASNLYWRVARMYDFGILAISDVLQFEIVGPGVQGNPAGLPTVQARAFSLYNIMEGKYGTKDELELAAHLAEMPLAEQLKIDNKTCFTTSEQLQKLAEVQYSNGEPAEGIVIRANDSSWSFKVINLLYKD